MLVWHACHFLPLTHPSQKIAIDARIIFNSSWKPFSHFEESSEVKHHTRIKEAEEFFRVLLNMCKNRSLSATCSLFALFAGYRPPLPPPHSSFGSSSADLGTFRFGSDRIDGTESKGTVGIFKSGNEVIEMEGSYGREIGMFSRTARNRKLWVFLRLRLSQNQSSSSSPSSFPFLLRRSPLVCSGCKWWIDWSLSDWWIVCASCWPTTTSTVSRTANSRSTIIPNCHKSLKRRRGCCSRLREGMISAGDRHEWEEEEAEEEQNIQAIIQFECGARYGRHWVTTEAKQQTKCEWNGLVRDSGRKSQLENRDSTATMDGMEGSVARERNSSQLL